jgi:general stress protein 26
LNLGNHQRGKANFKSSHLIANSSFEVDMRQTILKTDKLEIVANRGETMNQQQNQPDNQDVVMTNRVAALDTLKRHLHGMRFAMLTTLSEDGRLYSRPMTTQELGEDGKLWFLTSLDSQVATEAQHKPWVNLAYTNEGSSLYVSVSGHAALVKDREKIKELWNPMAAAYFPNGVDDSQLTLLSVDIDEAEVWDSPSAAPVRLFNMLKAIVTGKVDDQGHHEHLEVGAKS